MWLHFLSVEVEGQKKVFESNVDSQKCDVVSSRVDGENLNAPNEFKLISMQRPEARTHWDRASWSVMRGVIWLWLEYPTAQMD